MNRATLILLAALITAASVCCSCGSGYEKPDAESHALMLRLRGQSTYTDEFWDKTYDAVKDHPGCCDEVWFASGIGVPALETHRERAERIRKAAGQMKEFGIGHSMQISMTIGHADSFATGDEHLFSGLKWTGWTGSTGVVDRYCSCPRDHEFLEYLRQEARIYAGTGPRCVWIDDDLRLFGHVPATDGSELGCWCDNCISEFNSATGGSWTAETLEEAVGRDPELTESWKNFCISSLQGIARVIAEEFVKVSPGTRLGLQAVANKGTAEAVKAIMSTLHEVSGQDVCIRTGGGYYFDDVNADDQIVKSINSARFRHYMGDPDWIAEWCPEIECAPRVYGSRTPQGVLVEGFTALAYGMDDVSMYVMDPARESSDVYSDRILGPLADGAPALRAYAEANKGTMPVGYTADMTNRELYDFAKTAIPMIPDYGYDLGRLPKEGISSPEFTTEVSDRIQELREELYARSPAPVLCCSPFIGLMIPRADESGALRTIGLQNVRIDAQGPVCLRIDSLPESVRRVKWIEVRKKPVNLPVKRSEGSSYVTIPELSAWNAGFILIP